MFKYVELCVDMRRGRYAKDGIIQYRMVCQHVNVNSLEEVIKHFMQLSTAKAEKARSQVEALEEALDVDDLEVDKKPEDLMLSYVSGEMGKDRSDHELVTPWFKFLWKTNRTVLEILRNNSKMEALYAAMALMDKMIGREHGGTIVSRHTKVSSRETDLMHHPVKRERTILNFQDL